MADKLTPQQQSAVTDRGGNLLISAAAGSGKTKVLVERLMSYLTDIHNPANIDDFLIITYTKAAASELRMKIANRLNEAVAEFPQNQHLRNQLQRLHMANISTVHSFCSEILRQYAYQIDVPADFRMMDETETPELQRAVIEAVLEDSYTTEDVNSDFYCFIDSQGYGRNDSQVVDIILKVYASARCHLNPDTWLSKCEKSMDIKGITDAAQTVWGAYLMDDLHKHLDLQIDALRRCVDRALVSEGMEKVADLLKDTLTQLERIRSKTTWDDVYNSRNIDYGTLRFSKKCADLDLQEKIKAVRDGCKTSVAGKLRSFSAPSKDILADLNQAGSACRGLVTLVRKFAKEYEKCKQIRRIVDFGDLEHKSLDLFLGKSRTGPTRIAKEVGARFREVMVDEYQDTNEVQDSIFAALTDGRNNCFMVGDVKQSIYQFRLADPGIFIEKYQSFLPAEEAKKGEDRKILLSSNFRSSAGVISGVNDVFSACMSPEVGGLHYGDEEKLFEGRSHISIPDPEVTLLAVNVESDTYEEEAQVVADKIVKLLDGAHYVRDGDSLRPVTPEDIVILLRSPNSVGGEFRFALESRGIPYSTGDGENLLETEEISTLVSLLRILLNPLQDIPLLATLTSRVFGFTADEMAQMRSQNREASIFRLLKISNCDKAGVFLNMLHKLQRDAKLYNIPQLLEKIFDKTGFASVYSSLPDGEKRMENLQTFCQFAGAFEGVAGRELTFFIEHLDAMLERGMAISGQNSGGGVRIMSIHKSKGLEFPIVFLCGLSRNFNTESTRAQVLCDKDLGIGLSCTDTINRLRYPTIAKRAIAKKMIAEGISEEMRVLYVAMTRPMDRLIMTYASNRLEKTVTTLARKMDLCNGLLLTSGTTCPGDWILQTALMRTESGELFAFDVKPDCSCVNDRMWTVHVVTAEDSGKCFSAASAVTEEDVIDKIHEAISFVYPYSEASKTPSKQTATQIKGRLKDLEAAENTVEMKNANRRFRRPNFVTDDHPSTEYGNAYHTVMQHICWEAIKSWEDVSAELTRMVGDGFLTQTQASMIDVCQIHQFFASDVFQKLQGDYEVLREFKFSLLVDADLTSEEEVLLQGVVDLAVIQPDGIIIIDFKTDKVTNETKEERTKGYRSQILTYGLAMERIFQHPVKEKLLYYFKINEFVPIN